MDKKNTNKLRKSFIEQLKLHNADIEVFKLLIDDYLALFSVSEALKADISERGEIIREKNTAGYEVCKCNPSIKELRDTNKSMLAILKQLNLSLDTVLTDSEDEL